ncbi:MAG: 2,3-bisphosphoglycerate-independent phosphoglycerate mutase [Alphaproteobacteria bacterium]
MTKKHPTALLILDGWGHRENTSYNAPRLAKTPNFDRLWETCPRALLSASGQDVGLPVGQIGNSEVGHLNIGAGRVVMQTLPRIDRAIEDGTAWSRNVFKETIAQTINGSGRLHLVGLMSEGGVHAHQRHLAEMANALNAEGIEVILHLITDGRDTAPAIANRCFIELQRTLNFRARVGSVSGRFYAMDRDNRWERTGRALEVMRDAAGPKVSNVAERLEMADRDEFIEPFVVDGFTGMQDGDALACVNFRSDRVRQLLRALFKKGTPGFKNLSFSAVLGMAPYADDLDKEMRTLFPKENITNTLAEVTSSAGKRQFHLAETEKYPHVTFFLNGGREAEWPGEDRNVVPSPKVSTYDLAPEMSISGVSDSLNSAVLSGSYDLIVCNFANPDMVGHTGDLNAAIKACEAVDKALGSFLVALKKVGGKALVTADHGNAEIMWDEDEGVAHTAHTLSPVPLVYVGTDSGKLSDGRLADIAPTLLSLMGITKPHDMTGVNLWSDA